MLDPSTLDDEARFKLALMTIIDQDLRERFRTVEDAAEYADVDRFRLHRIRAGRYDQFSVSWLFKLARAAKVRIRINIDPGPKLNRSR
jgi:hypothetical protein